MSEQSLYGIALALLMLGCVLFGRRTAQPGIGPSVVYETRVDTMVVRDTIVREKPVYSCVYVRDTIRVWVSDTIFVELPREVKVYEDSSYRAEVSGFQPTLDRIEVYPQTTTITKTETRVQTIRRNARWGIGVQAGYGIGVHSGAVYTTPYIGVGVSWNIITF